MKLLVSLIILVVLFLNCQNPVRDNTLKLNPNNPIIDSIYLSAKDAGRSVVINLLLRDTNNTDLHTNTLILYRSFNNELYKPVLQKIPGNKSVLVFDNANFPLDVDDFYTYKYMILAKNQNDSLSDTSNVVEINLLKQSRIDSIMFTFSSSDSSIVSFIIYKDLKDADYTLSIKDTLDSLIWTSGEKSEYDKNIITCFGPKLYNSNNYYATLLVYRNQYSALTVKRFSLE